MSERKTLNINSNLLKAIVLGFVLGTLAVFITEHFGKFAFIPITNSSSSNGKASFNYSYSYSDKVSTIDFMTPFGTTLTFPGENFTVLDLASEYENDYNKYSHKVQYYLAGTKADSQYIFYFGIAFTIIIFFILNYKIKFG